MPRETPDRIETPKRPVARRRAGTLLALLAAAGLASAAGTARADIRVALVGAPQTVFRHDRDACADDDIPDTPARAFRDDRGQVHLLAPHYVDRGFVGPDLDHLKHDCRVVFRGGGISDPARFDDRGWITSVYTLDGRTVFALVHDEFHAEERPGMCPSGRFSECWYNAITSAVSHDAGMSFVAPAERLVAAVPYRFAPQGHRVGYFNPSNIVGHDGFYYVVAFVEAVGQQERGNCVLRTDRLDQPGSWRAWDGKGYSVALADPYKIAPTEAATHLCVPISTAMLPWSITSLAWHPKTGRWVAILRGARDGRGLVLASDSADLVHWSPPQEVMAAPLLEGYPCGGPAPIAYPSMIDPASPSRSFDTVGDRAYLYYTRFNMAGCREGMDRDLLRVAVELK